MLHVIDPLAFSKVFKTHWPFKAVVIEGFYYEVSELETCLLVKRPIGILICLICQRFKDGILKT